MTVNRNRYKQQPTTTFMKKLDSKKKENGKNNWISNFNQNNNTANRRFMTVKPSFQGLIVLFVSSSSLCQLSYIPVFSICFVELNSIIAHFYLYLCARERIIEKKVGGGGDGQNLVVVFFIMWITMMMSITKHKIHLCFSFCLFHI